MDCDDVVGREAGGGFFAIFPFFYLHFPGPSLIFIDL